MKRIELLFFITLIYLVTPKKKYGFKKKFKFPTQFLISRTVKLSTQLQTPKTVKFYYRADNDLPDNIIQLAYKLLQTKTCLIFEKVSGSLSFNETIIRRGDNCSASAEIISKKVHYYINLNKSCTNKEMIQRLTYLSINMMVQISKCISKIEHSKEEIPDKILDLHNIYECYIEHVDGAEQEYVNENLLQFSCLAFPKKKGIRPKDLKQKDYSNEISFKDLKFINRNMCNDSCKSTPSVECANGGYLDTKNCSECVCPFFFSGPHCENYTKPKKTSWCLEQSWEVSSNLTTKELDLGAECYYNIKPSNNKKIVLMFKPVTQFYWNCDFFKILEIKYVKDKSVDGVMPCGNITSFNLTGIVNSSVLIYHDRIVSFEPKVSIQYMEIGEKKLEII